MIAVGFYAQKNKWQKRIIAYYTCLDIIMKY